MPNSYNITAMQKGVLQSLLDNDDRVAFYLKLNEFTGSKSALLMAQISSSSGVVGGTAWAVNETYNLALPGYPGGGVGVFSRAVASADNDSIRPDPSVPGNFLVPSDQEMLLGAHNVWKTINPAQDLGYAFPGNGLIALNYLSEGNFTAAAPFVGYAAITAPILAPLGLNELYWETLNSPWNAGKSIDDFLMLNPGAHAVSSQGGNITAIIGVDGKTIGAFVQSQLETLPVSILGQLRGLVADARTIGYRLWSDLSAVLGHTGNSMPSLDVLNNVVEFAESSSAVVSSGRDPLNLNYIQDVYENGAVHRYPANKDLDGGTLVLSDPRETWTLIGRDGGSVILEKVGNGDDVVFNRRDISATGEIVRRETYEPEYQSSSAVASNYKFNADAGGIQNYISKQATGITIDESISVPKLDAFGNPIPDKYEFTTAIDGSIVTFGVDYNVTEGFRIFQILRINGQSPLESSVSLANDVLQDLNIDPHDIHLQKGLVTPLIAAVNPNNNNGTTEPISGGAEWWKDPAIQKYNSIVPDMQALLGALRAGKPLPIATSIFNMAATLSSDPTIANISGALGILGSLDAFGKALDRGDFGQALISGGTIVRGGLTIYLRSLEGQIGALKAALEPGQRAIDPVLKSLNAERANVAELLQGVGYALAVFNLVNSLAKGDVLGVVQAGLGIMALNEVPWAGIASMILTAFSAAYDAARDTDYNAHGRYKLLSDGSIGVELLNNENNAGERLTEVMNDLLGRAKSFASTQGQLLGQDMTVIAERLPELRMLGGEGRIRAFIMFYKDPDTGVQYARSFDAGGGFAGPGFTDGYIPTYDDPYLDPKDAYFQDEIATANGPLGRDPFFQDLGEQFGEMMYASGAIVPKWMADTIKAQSGIDPDAGLTTAQRASNAGLLLPGDPGNAAGGSTEQTFRPIVLELQVRDDISFRADIPVTPSTISGGSGGVLFDVDDDGYAEEVDWIGPREGFLMLDRNGDGLHESGQDMFSDPKTAWNDSASGWGVLKEIDANLDGLIDANDPAFSHLRVWQDVNHNGIMDKNAQGEAFEVKTLAELGISDLRYGDSGSYHERYVDASYGGGRFYTPGDNNVKHMEIVPLKAEAAGVITTSLGDNTILVARENGGIELMAASALDYGSLDYSSVTGGEAVRQSHLHASADQQLRTTDELIQGQEDTLITVSVEQLLRNDQSSATGALTFVGISSASHGVATFHSAKNAVSFQPDANYFGLASFSYTVRDAQGREVDATTYVEVSGTDDAPVLSVQVTERAAGWADVRVDIPPPGEGGSGAAQYSLPPSALERMRMPATQPPSWAASATTR